jgi:hypothetical protein
MYATLYVRQLMGQYILNLASEIQLIIRRKSLDVRYKGLEEVHILIIFIRLP